MLRLNGWNNGISTVVAGPELVVKVIIPAVMVGIVAIYGLDVYWTISRKVTPHGKAYTIDKCFR